MTYRNPPTTPRKSATFDDYTLSEIRRAAATGIYDIRGARRQAQAAAFRRPVVPRRLDLALSARRLSRALRHQRGAGGAPCEKADRAEDPDHHCRHELRLALRPGQGGARPRRDARRHLDDDRRRRHDRRGTRPFADAGLPVSAVALRHEPARPQARRCDRDRGRPGRQARRRRHAARPEDLRPRRRDADAAERHRPALRLPPSRLDRSGRSRDQDPRTARDHRLGKADLRQGRRRQALLRHRAGGEGRRRCRRARRHAGRHGGDAGGVHRACRASRRSPASGRPCRRCRISACTARCS